jgi:primosomal protein N' (replication factor Y) (superfamily II helicase)
VLISVAVPVPALPLLTYRLPPESPTAARGARVLVPLGRRTVTGIIVGPAEGPEPDGVRDATEILDATPFLPDEVVDLALWVADYYLASPGDALASAAPPFAWVESEPHYELTDEGRHLLDGPAASDPLLGALSRGRRTLRGLIGKAANRKTVEASLRSFERKGLVRRTHALPAPSGGFRTGWLASLTTAGASAAEALTAGQSLPGLGERQQASLTALAASRVPLALASLRERGSDLGTLRRLASRGLVHLQEQRIDRDPFAAGAALDVPLEAVRELTADQQSALAALTALADEQRFHAALLHGVTGSGKTELYVRLARHTIALGRRVLVLVPEIALTPQMAAQFRAAFGDRVAIQHSGMADGERHDQWHRVRAGDVDLVVGTRSAVFTPIEHLGLIVVDEEHDTSYKQDEAPRYHGRDVAIVRAKEARALVVLGSATPALESYANAESGRYAKVVLARRVLDRPLADVTIVDMRDEYAELGPEVILSRALAGQIGERLARGEQSLLLLNRRGYATAVFCRQCGHILDCPNCSVSLTVHRRGTASARAICHYCNHSVRVPATCEKCAAPYMEQSGFGTERVEAEVERLFPAARVGRVDRDTMRKRGEVSRILGRFGRGELDVLVGTQMIAKGHDFAGVTLVGVVSADMGLGLADFRAAERTFQLLTQVAGRAGRGERPGAAIIQTINPGHYSIRLACRQDYAGFYAEERRYRRAMHYPPEVAIVNVVIRGESLADAMGAAADLASKIPRSAGIGVLGPAPAPLARLRGEYRAQVFLKSRHRRAMRDALRSALASLPDLARRVTVDVDPVGML